MKTSKIGLTAAISSLLSPCLTSPILQARAGAPISQPIPDTCTLCNRTSSTSSSFTIADSFKTANSLYAYYLQDDASNKPDDALINQCAETCYGYGDTGDCVSVLFARNVPYSSFGVNSVGTACLLFKTRIEQVDLVDVTDGHWTEAKAVNIEC